MTVSGSFILTNERAVHNAETFIDNNWRAMSEKGEPLVVQILTKEQQRTLWQNNKLHGLCETISKQYFFNGRTSSPEVWKYLLKCKFLKMIEMEDIRTGEVKFEPISTAKLGVKAFDKFLLEIEAYATQELGVNIMAYREGEL